MIQLMKGSNLSARVKRVFRSLETDDIRADLILLKNGIEPHLDLSFFYLTGVESGLFEGSSLIAYPDGKTILYTSILEEESARKSGVRSVKTFRDEKEEVKLLKKEIGDTATIGINARELTYSDFLSLKQILRGRYINVSSAISKARMIKDQHEIAHLRRSAEIANRTFSELPSILNDSITESEAAAVLNSTMLRYGASSPSFETIVAFGPNSSEPHYSPKKRRLKKGDYALFDFGAKYMKYCSDISRTLVYGTAPKELRDIYQIVLQANVLGIEALKSGEIAKDVHNKVAKFIDSTRYRGRFIHATGHTIGLAVHDGGSLSSRSETKLENGMVFTVEPGIYVPGLGGVRIEDDVVVRGKKPDVLTHAPKELIEV